MKTEQDTQIHFAIMQIKIQLLALAKDMVKDQLVSTNIIETYLDLREEILGIPKPKENT